MCAPKLEAGINYYSHKLIVWSVVCFVMVTTTIKECDPQEQTKKQMGFSQMENFLYSNLNN